MNFPIDYQPPFPLPLPSHLLSPVSESLVVAELVDHLASSATHMARELGFGRVATTADHPNCAELIHLVSISAATKRPLPIWSTGATLSIFRSRDAALSLRFLRLMARFRLKACSCDAASEYAADDSVLDDALFDGVSDSALKYLYGELKGSTTLRSLGYGTPVNSAAFTRDVLRFGIPDAVVLEAERREKGRHCAESQAA